LHIRSTLLRPEITRIKENLFSDSFSHTLLLFFGRIGYHLHPTPWATFDIWVVTLRILAIIPVIGFLLLLFVIHRRLLLNDYWRGCIIGIGVGIIIRIKIRPPHY